MKISRFSAYITNHLISNRIIDNDDFELYKYGFYILFSFFYFVLISIIFGLIFSNVFNMILFTIFFIPLRLYAGGYHAKTESKCLILSSLFCVFSATLIKIMCQKELFIVAWVAILLGIICISFFSAKGVNNKEILKDERDFYRRIVWMILSVIFILAVIFSILKINNMVYIISTTISLESFLLLINRKDDSNVENI